MSRASRGRSAQCSTACCAFAASVLALLLFSPLPLGAEEVDLQLVIAVDVSTSMDSGEKLLQQEGFAAAFSDPDLIEAIALGRFGKVAVAYFEWGGERRQRLVLPWTLIADAEDAMRVSAFIRRNRPHRFNRGTSISGALAFASARLAEGPYRGARRLVNLSGDGVNNSGLELRRMRDWLIGRGVTINGMPLVYKRRFDGVLNAENDHSVPSDLVDYFNEEVVGGAGAFVEPVWSKADYAAAIKRKLLREISPPLHAMDATAPLPPPYRTASTE